jgi:hypothetical protein
MYTNFQIVILVKTFWNKKFEIWWRELRLENQMMIVLRNHLQDDDLFKPLWVIDDHATLWARFLPTLECVLVWVENPLITTSSNHLHLCFDYIPLNWNGVQDTLFFITIVQVSTNTCVTLQCKPNFGPNQLGLMLKSNYTNPIFFISLQPGSHDFPKPGPRVWKQTTLHPSHVHLPTSRPFRITCRNP